MLEAEPAELAGTAGTPLAEHIASCPRCGAVAERLLAVQDELVTALDRQRPSVPVEEALRRARQARDAAAVRAGAGPGRWPWLAGSAAAALAAAVILAVVLLSGPEPPAGEPWAGGGEMALVEPEEPAPAVEAPEDRNVMVLDTGNPKVRIVWVY